MIVQFAYSQKSVTYGWHCYPYSLYLSLDTRNRYSFQLNEMYEGSDIITVTDLSVGYYRYRSDTLLLSDIRGRYSMYLERNPTTLKIIKGYDFLQNQYLDHIRDHCKNLDELFMDYYYIQKVNLNTIKTQDNIPLTYGLYKGSFGASVSLMDGNIYFFSIDSLIISRGWWNQDGNIITLHDSILDASFYLLIKANDVLNNINLPGSYSNDYYYRIGWP